MWVQIPVLSVKTKPILFISVSWIMKCKPRSVPLRTNHWFQLR